jgi:hypothetical protein
MEDQNHVSDNGNNKFNSTVLQMMTGQQVKNWLTNISMKN